MAIDQRSFYETLSEQMIANSKDGIGIRGRVYACFSHVFPGSHNE